jgi:hypothetical protein
MDSSVSPKDEIWFLASTKNELAVAIRRIAGTLGSATPLLTEAINKTHLNM